MKILAVDDDPIFLEILDKTLRSFGYDDITTLTSPIEALRLLERQAALFDCILLDVQMPQMTGIELCRRIRSLSTYRRTPIVNITSMATKIYIDDAFAAGATDYITKPLDPTELKARIGMVERLVHERLRAALLEHQIGQRGGAVTLDFDFNTPVMIPGFDRGIEYLALQNYLLTLGIKGMYSVSAFAICIENAGVLFRKATPLSFMNMLSDVASVIEETLKTGEVLIAYAGSGVFLGVVKGLSDWQREEFEAAINAGVEDFDSIYIADRLPTPQVKVGPIVRNSFFSPARPARILERAIAAVETRPERPTGKTYAIA